MALVVQRRTASHEGLEPQALKALVEISSAIGAELDTRRVAHLAGDHARKLLGVDAAYIWIWSTEENALRLFSGNDVRGLQPLGEIGDLGQSAVGHALLQRQPVVVDDYQNWEHARQSVAIRGARSVVSVPLLVNDRAVGAMAVHTYEPRHFTGAEVQLLSLFGGQVASALEAARLYDESERRGEEIRALNADLERRVMERTAELEAANKELEAFAYSVSHDLRAPLRSIDGFSQVLLEDYGDQLDEQAKGILGRVRSASQRMAQLIDDLLQLSRLTRVEMQRQRVDVSQIARAAIDELRSRDPERQVDVRITPGLAVKADPRLIEIALKNLLGNAWKFTSKHEQAQIEFGVKDIDGQRAYFVRDDGAGFDMAYADKLFGPFQRLHRATEFEGTGIGLAIVQRVIIRHGGRVWAEGAIEQGACFFFTLD